MSRLQKGLLSAVFVAAVATGIYEARQASALRNQVQTLQQQQASLTGQIQQLQSQRDDAANRLALLASEIFKTKSNSPELELLKLRGEVARLRYDSRDLSQLKEASTNDPDEAQMKSWLAQIRSLKQRLEQTPDKQIPELQFLTDQDWFNAIGKTNVLHTDAEFRNGFANVRREAKEKFAPMLQVALNKYTAAHDNQLPDDPSQLKPYIDPLPDDADVILRRYKMLRTGKIRDLPSPGALVLGEKAPVDDQSDSYFAIGLNGYSKSGVEAYTHGIPDPR